MTTIDYRRRASLAQPAEILWRSHSDRLEEIGADGNVLSSLPLRNVREVRIDFAPGRSRQTRFIMEVTGLRSRRLVSNMHLTEQGEIEDRSDSFFQLVRHVVSSVSAANPKATFWAGAPPLMYGWMVALNLAGFGLLVSLILALPISPANEVLAAMLKAVLIVFSLALMLSWAIQARPRRLRARRQLENLLAARSD